MDPQELFLKYQQKKEKYIQRLEKTWEEDLSPKEALALAKVCSDILDSIIAMGKDLRYLAHLTSSEDSALDSMSDEELERYLTRTKKALLKESTGDLET